jgi:hypothetical protein
MATKASRKTRAIENEKINKGEMADAILRSGYLLEQRVEDALRSRGYFVSANDSYVDPDTGKAREIDIYATGAERVSRKREFIFPKIICECENNSQPVVLFVKDSQISFLHYLEMKVAGMPSQCLSSGGNAKELVPVQEFLGLGKYHHYCRGPVATQYCSFLRKRQQPFDWMAKHVDEHHESLTKLICALEFYIDEYYRGYSPPKKDEVELVNLEFYYPLLILEGPLYKAQLKRDRLVLSRTYHAQFRKEYHVRGKGVTYQIDVIAERFLTKYLDLIEEEMQKTVSVMKRKKAVVRASIDLMVSKAKKKRPPESYRSVLEYRYY